MLFIWGVLQAVKGLLSKQLLWGRPLGISWNEREGEGEKQLRNKFAVQYFPDPRNFTNYTVRLGTIDFFVNRKQLSSVWQMKTNI